MTYTNPSAAPARRQRSPLVYVGVGCVVIALCALCVGVAGAGWYFYTQSPTPVASRPAVEYILDASPRMAQPSDGESGTRLAVAQGVLAEIIRPSDPTVTAGLRVFGTGAIAVSCQDTNLLVPLAPANQGQIANHVLALSTGTNASAAMGEAMIMAIRDLAATKGDHTLVVVTGGPDSCNPQAGQLIAAEAKKDGIQLQLFVVGYQVSTDDGNAIKGLVDGAGGNYVSAKSKTDLSTILASIQQYVNNSSTNSVASVLATAAAAAGAGTSTPAAATAVVTPAPTSSGAPTAVATTAVAQAATATSGANATGPTACDHAYFPLRPGSTWTFSSSSGQLTWNVTGVTGDLNDATATMDSAVSTGSVTFHWHCTAGGIDSYDFGNLAVAATGVANLKVTQHSGYWLLPANQLTVGASWDNAYTIQYDLTAGGTSVTFVDDVTRHSTVAATEQQTVAGVNHDALRVESTEVSHLSIGGTAGTTANTTTTIWLVRGIGPVRLDSLDSGSTTSFVLSSYHIP